MQPKYNSELFFYPGRTGFVIQRLLRISNSLFGLQIVLGQNRGLRLGSISLKWGSSFLWLKKYVKEGSSLPRWLQWGNMEGWLLDQGLWETRNYLESSSTMVSERYVQERFENGHLSLQRPCQRIMDEGLLYRGLLRERQYFIIQDQSQPSVRL
jgi:hypothetical protein